MPHAVRSGAIGFGLVTILINTIIAIADEDLADLLLPTAKAIEIVSFVPYRDIDPIRIGEGHYLEPGSQVAVKPFTPPRRALERNSKAAVARFA
ncbi:Ku protein [Streptomyces sp. CB01635]|uniref:Ku protein n=1 Tax=unclassified Streptomyces TaxID=2593676 RepID=UPI0018FE505E|nr:Ku protein [Streptomyces sp. CB01635]